MTNRRGSPVEYRPFKADPLLAEGLLGVERGGGELEAKVASAMFRLAEEIGNRNDRRAARQGEIAGQMAAIAGAPRGYDVSGGEPVGPTTPFNSNDPVAKDIPAEGRALLNAIAGGESAGSYNVRYTPEGGRHFADLSKHPGIAEKGPHGPSTAAGRYQFLESTWQRMGGGAFTPEHQDHAAWRLAQEDYQARTGRPLLADLQAGGLTPKILSALSPTWTSFNSKRGRKIATYQDSLLRFAGTGEAAPATVSGTPPAADKAALAVRAPGIVVTGGNAAAFRPSGRDTVYGRAYDAAGTKTYLQVLSAEMESTTAQIFAAYGDDPAKLQEAFQDLKEQELKDHVFPEIAGDYAVAFERRAGAFVMQAQRNLEKRQAQENRAAFLTRTQDLETGQAQALAALDPDNPAATAELWRNQAAIDDHYDAAVEHDLLGADDAATAKATSRRATAVGFYLKQADALDADGVAGLAKSMKADFGAGKLDGIDATGWEKLQDGLGALEREKRTAGKRANGALEERGSAFLKRAAEGVAIDQAELGRFILDARTAPDGSAIVRQTLSLINVADRLKDLPIGKAEAIVRSMREDLGPNSTDRDIETVDLARKMVDATRKSLTTDLLSHAERMGVVEPSGSVAEADSPEELKEIVAGRIDAAEAAAEHFGVAPRYFKAGEAQAIEKMVESDPVAGARIAGAIVAGAGSRAGEVLSEFGKEAPIIAGAGAILADGGSARAAEDAIAGAGKAPDGRVYPAIEKALRSGAAADHLGAALALQPQDGERVRQVADWIAKKRVFDAGLDPKSEDAREIYTRALDEAAGAVLDRGVQYGGFARMGDGFFAEGYQVLVPNEIRADRFDDVLGALRQGDIAKMRVLPVKADGSPFDVRQLAQFRPVAVAGGYAFARHDPESDDPQFVRGSDGRPWVLDIAGMARVLAPRVPGAFRGY